MPVANNLFVTIDQLVTMPPYELYALCKAPADVSDTKKDDPKYGTSEKVYHGYYTNQFSDLVEMVRLISS